jgi:hypothetical protein
MPRTKPKETLRKRRKFKRRRDDRKHLQAHQKPAPPTNPPA